MVFGNTGCCSLFGDRQQRVRRPPNNAYDGRRTRCCRAPDDEKKEINMQVLLCNLVATTMY